jgi:hypothetical protein
MRNQSVIKNQVVIKKSDLRVNSQCQEKSITTEENSECNIKIQMVKRLMEKKEELLRVKA